MKRQLLLIAAALMLFSCGGGGTSTSSTADGASSSNTPAKPELGIWSVKHYVDEFNDPTDDAYVRATVTGTFSNSATTNSALEVKIIIDNDNIRFDLYEYARNHPTKREGVVNFKARDNDGGTVEFKTYNYKNGVNSVDKKDFAKVKELLLKGGEIKFVASPVSRYGTKTEYKFTINDASHLQNALNEAGF